MIYAYAAIEMTAERRPTMINVENKVVIITGASSGLGEETARVLAKNGAKVILSARRQDRLEKTGRGNR